MKNHIIPLGASILLPITFIIISMAYKIISHTTMPTSQTMPVSEQQEKINTDETLLLQDKTCQFQLKPLNAMCKSE